MEVTKILEKINVPTDNLKMESIQKLLLLSKRDLKTHYSKELWNNVVDKLWINLLQCLDNLDDQLLCATCFYSILALTDRQDYYLDKVFCIVSREMNRSSQSICDHIPDSKELGLVEKESNTNIIGTNELNIQMLQVVSLMYGMFQSSFLTQKYYPDISKIERVLKKILDLLVLMGYQYSQYTFLVFKTLKSLMKLCGGPLEKHIFKKEYQVNLLVLVNNNWENPVTGVRDFNRSIFRTVLSTLDGDTYKRVLNEVDNLYWNKAKYLMLTEIIENYNGSLAFLIQEKWIDGLIYSLHKPGLVSAGADMYYAILKIINNQEDWCKLFLNSIVNLLESTETKAIDNFSNYWCLNTLHKFKGLANVLIEELEKQDSEVCLHFKLCVIKQANKIGGIIDKNLSQVEDTTIQNAVLCGIDHYNYNIRILSFNIVCVSQKKSIPSKLEFNLILDYLRNNINADSTVLRLNMFSIFDNFLSQLHTTFINTLKKYEVNDDIDSLLEFCKKLQYIVVNNLNFKGNYQRKITSVKLCNSIITYFKVVPKKKRDYLVYHDVPLKEFLNKRGLWLLSSEEFIMKLIDLLCDPSEDIRENVIKILLSHYSDELQNVTLLTLIINNANKNIRSKYFYDISCGHSMFKLLTSVLLKGKLIETEYRTVEDIFEYAHSEIMNGHHTLINIMDSIESGKQLHAFMSILITIFEECIRTNYTINIHKKLPELLTVLESISTQFQPCEATGSTDFSVMNNMIQNILDESAYNIFNGDDLTKISGQQHIVLNCLWLNVKAACDLASILIQYNKDDANMCEHCLNIITRVLETSRHKGVIEAAGAALGRAIQCLTTLPKIRRKMPKKNFLVKNSDISQLPQILLQRKLHELISETSTMSSITRRGAGLSIMVHRIVSSDMQNGKPLFHFFIKTLLQRCKSNEEIDGHPIEIRDDTQENRVDLPEAIYIHFLTRIVTDSSLSTDTMYYAVELAELAFGNLTSPHWQIRNAALQLYGALIPRLIGQKKASGTDEETVATVACDEIRTHLPKLWNIIVEQLSQKCGKNDIQAHSDLVPILNMLANSAKRYNFSFNIKEQEPECDSLFYSLMSLLNSPIFTVRRLTAKTIFNLYTFEYISDGVMKQNNITENLIHGLLLLLNLCHNYYHSDPSHENSFRQLMFKFHCIFNNGSHSYLNRKLFEDMYEQDIDLQFIENSLLETRINMPAVHIWAEARINKYITKCSWYDIPSLLQLLLQQNDYNMYCENILFKIESQDSIPADVLIKIVDILCAFEKRFHSCVIWKIIYAISIKTNLSINTEMVRKFTYNIRYMIPVLAKNIANYSNEDKEALVALLNDLSDFEKSDADNRHIAAVANNELAKNFNELPDYLKVDSLKCAILLLQDEDEDIRNLSGNFYSNLTKGKQIFQPYICLNKILDKNFLCAVFADPQNSIQELYRKLNYIILHSNHIKDEYNPFANDSKNIYFEPDALKQAIDGIL